MRRGPIAARSTNLYCRYGQLRAVLCSFAIFYGLIYGSRFRKCGIILDVVTNRGSRWGIPPSLLDDQSVKRASVKRGILKVTLAADIRIEVLAEKSAPFRVR